MNESTKEICCSIEKLTRAVLICAGAIIGRNYSHEWCECLSADADRYDNQGKGKDIIPINWAKRQHQELNRKFRTKK